MNAKGVRKRRERRRREALGHPISPIKGGGNVGEFQSAVASLLAQVVGAHVEVLGRAQPTTAVLRACAVPRASHANWPRVLSGVY